MSIPRRSERKTKGIPPERYEDAPDNLKQATESRKSTHPSCTHDKSILRVESKITKSSNSRRKLLEIEIEEARKLAEIERRKAEIDAEMIIKEAQLRRKIIQEGSSKKSTISGAESIFDLREMTFQEKVDNWKTEESDNYVPPMTNNFITMTSDNFNQICETFKINSDKIEAKVGIDGCQKFHNNILHNLDYKTDEPQVENTPDIVLDQDDHIERINFFQEESPTILLRIIPVKLRGRKKEISTFALLDEAATTTMIDSRIAQEISDLKTNKPIKKSSRLYTLTPFLDGKGILRIGVGSSPASLIKLNISGNIPCFHSNPKAHLLREDKLGRG
ncbi:hypothetical protein JTB14_008480 [Gonioctena quinquepunctata]|nr:hypothetical protein JTB14_008480 [Gonioctena quinquepunctata]